MKKILCKTCYFQWHFEKRAWCSIIETESGGSIEANQVKCPHYLKRGTEPQWLCCKCGKNVFGHSATGEGGKWWCNSCYLKEETKRRVKEKAIQHRENLKKISDILGGDTKKAKQIMELLTPE